MKAFVSAALLFVLSASPAAWATVDIVYTLEPGSQLITPTPVGLQFDPLTETGGTPTWIDGSLATPPVDYGSDVPGVTTNTILIRFTDDGAGNVVDGPIEIVAFDWFHNIDAQQEPNFTLTGLNDTELFGAIGTLAGTTVEVWGTDPSGLAHNELTCQNGNFMICGTLGLPADGTTEVVHAITTLPIDVTGTTPGSSPMTFSNNFQTISFQITLDPDNGSGRQFYSFTGPGTVTEPVPSAGPLALLVLAMTGLGLALARRVHRA